MSKFLPRDSKDIQEFYTHPKYVNEHGQGRYVMFTIEGKIISCASGNELKQLYEMDSSKWLTGPIWLPLSKEDHRRVHLCEQNKIERI